MRKAMRAELEMRMDKFNKEDEESVDEDQKD